VVVSAHRLASEAGAKVLRRGGNAFDAAIATSLMLGVVEPAFSGVGGGGFALLHTASGEDLALDYRETAPLKATASMFAEGSDTNRVGPLAVATPGLLAGHSKILELYGSSANWRNPLSKPLNQDLPPGASPKTSSPTGTRKS